MTKSEVPPTAASPASPPSGGAASSWVRRARRTIIRGTLLLLLVAVAGLALWTIGALTYTYSQGERAGYLQKFSRRGWICKTWEGELALVNLPGAMPEVFNFSVRDEKAVAQLQAALGKRVVLYYDQHVGVPTNCFGETEYFITGVKEIGPVP